ncbi:MAG TPA: hypothetical protein EYO94_05310 [Acidobacteria bacterium]|nr:hypothetical protein [Acidobacteriota bacterium]
MLTSIRRNLKTCSRTRIIFVLPCRKSLCYDP